MIKKSLVFLSISAAFFANAQDVSVIKNSVDVYSASLPGTSKYNAMAGSMGALGGDISALNSNPAGLGVFITSDLSGTLNIQNSKNTTSIAGKALDYKINKTDLGNIGGVAVFEVSKNSPWKFVNLGVSFSGKSIEDYSETPANPNIKFNVPNNETLIFNGHAYNRTGNVSKMSLGLGANYNNNLYFGGGINIHSANLTQYDSASLILESNGKSEVFNKQYTPYAEDAAGFSASLGVIGKVNNQFRLGAALETPTWWNIDRTYSYYSYSGNEDGEFSENRKLTTPLKATLSAAFVPNKNFAVNVDYSLGLTKPKYTTEDAGSEAEFKNFFENNYKNVSEVKIGAEYRYQQFRLRGGYGFATNPFDSMTIAAISDSGADANVSSSQLYVGKRNTLGVGIGYDFKSFYIDAAYQNISSEYDSPFLKGSAEAGTEYYSQSAFVSSNASAISNVKNTQNNVSVTLGWKF